MNRHKIRGRFRGFLPIVVDVETGGLEAATDALLEVAAITIVIDSKGGFAPGQVWHEHIEPFAGARLDEKALKINRIDPYYPLRLALPEREALEALQRSINESLEYYACTRAILVGHNAFFDLSFIKAAWRRNKMPDFPFHSFSSIDTVTLGLLAYGQTVLSRIVSCTGLQWDEKEAHSALYDAKMTAEVCCRIFNRWDKKIKNFPK